MRSTAHLAAALLSMRRTLAPGPLLHRRRRRLPPRRTSPLRPRPPVRAVPTADPCCYRGSAGLVASHGSRLAFLVLRQGMGTVQCVVHAGRDDSPGVSPGIVRFAASLAA